jgi:choline dehydrogenase
VPLSTLGSLGDSALDALLRENPGPVFHAVGACRMGARPGNGTCTSCEPTAAGAVWNVAGLVVADTSIFPDLVSGGLQLPAVAVAERVAHWLVG